MSGMEFYAGVTEHGFIVTTSDEAGRVCIKFTGSGNLPPGLMDKIESRFKSYLGYITHDCTGSHCIVDLSEVILAEGFLAAARTLITEICEDLGCHVESGLPDKLLFWPKPPSNPIGHLVGSGYPAKIYLTRSSETIKIIFSVNENDPDMGREVMADLVNLISNSWEFEYKFVKDRWVLSFKTASELASSTLRPSQTQFQNSSMRGVIT